MKNCLNLLKISNVFRDIAVPIFECPLCPFRDLSLFNVRLDLGFYQPDPETCLPPWIPCLYPPPPTPHPNREKKTNKQKICKLQPPACSLPLFLLQGKHKLRKGDCSLREVRT